MFVCLLSWTYYVCLFVKLDISWLFVCLTGLCYDFGGQKMATRWRWHRFKLENMKFSLLFSGFWWIFAKFLVIFTQFSLIFAKFSMTFTKFSMILAKFLMIFGISCAHYGTVTQCSVDPQCASSAKTKHLETSQKLSETLKKNHETSRK